MASAWFLKANCSELEVQINFFQADLVFVFTEATAADRTISIAQNVVTPVVTADTMNASSVDPTGTNNTNGNTPHGESHDE